MESRLPRYAPQRRPTLIPSFRAPTKASPARSHLGNSAKALSQPPARQSMRDSQDGPENEAENEAETRGFGLRDRKALRPSLPPSASPADPLTGSPLSSARRSSAFAAPPRRVSKRISASEILFRSPTASREKEDNVMNTPEGQLASELGSATAAIDMDNIEGHLLQGGFEEPDLPPTPTQLGLERPPERPRGLLSSSPSMQHDKWKKRQLDTEKSPSKLRTIDTLQTWEITTGKENESVIKKRKLRRHLLADLESIKQDIAKLEGLSDKLEQQENNHVGDITSILNASCAINSVPHNLTISSLISTLLPFSTKRPPKTRPKSPKVNSFTLEQNTQAYLSALAPLNIISSSTTISSPALNVKHQMTLAAPRPCPASLYTIHVSYETNPETQSLVSLFADFEGSTPVYLQQWATRRLGNRLLKLDVSGLCWGFNRYWDALVSRAQLWAQIEEQHQCLIPGTRKTDTDNTPNMRQILPNLQRTSMLFNSKQRPIQILLSCEIELDEWTGEPELSPTISVLSSSSNEKTEQELKRLFQEILSEGASHQSARTEGSDAQALVKATNCVLEALG
ncbi:hypothetical protein BJX70DRAFT_392528 [Aspergillus crustosus]